MSKLGTTKYAYALIATNLKAMVALRGAFFLQAFFMLANNLIFFTIWWIFFSKFEEIRGWKFEDMFLLFGIATISIGLANVVAGGVRHLARIIVDGELDSYLTLPKNPIVRAAASRMEAMGWGDMASGVIFFAFSGAVTWTNLPIIAACIICGAVFFAAAVIMFESLAFWLGPMEDLARWFREFLITFAIYPSSMFSGWVKVVLFTLLPAGFISYLPVEIIRDQSWEAAGWLALGVVIYSAACMGVFKLGIKRYESGNRFGVHA